MEPSRSSADRADPSADRGADRWTRASLFTLALLLLVSALLRFWAAAPNPGPKRFWDERYLAANTARVLEDGWGRPQNVYYPGLGHLPTAAILASARALGAEEGSLLASRRQLGPLGYRIARSVTVAWGLLGILFVFLLGRRLAGDAVGLGAAALLAFTPWHLRQSILYKPDIVLCTLVAVVLWACLRLLERDTRWRWLALWGSAALAVSAKWNAAPLLVPVAVAAWIRVRRTGIRQSLPRLAIALAAGAIAIVAINPTLVLEPSAYLRDLSKTATHYEGRAEKADASKWQMPLHAAHSLASNDFLGVPLALLGLAGLIWCCFRPAPAPRNEPGEAEAAAGGGDGAERRRLAWRIVASWPLAYVAVYSAATAYPSPHNWLPLLPVVALGAAATLAVATRALDLRWGRLGVTAVALLALLLVAERAREVWQLSEQEAVPTTAQEAERLLRASFTDDLGGRVVVSSIPLHDRLWSFAVQGRTLDPRQPRLLTLPLTRGTGLERAWRADGVVWRPGELAGSTGGSTCRLPDLDESPGGSDQAGELVRVRARPFRIRGETLCVWLRPWSREGGAVERALDPEAEAPAVIGSSSEGAPDGGWIVVDLVVTGASADALPSLVFDAEPRGEGGSRTLTIPCHLLRVAGRRTFCRTERFSRSPESVVRMIGPFRHGRATVHRWRP